MDPSNFIRIVARRTVILISLAVLPTGLSSCLDWCLRGQKVDKAVHVLLLSGQSNMVGRGVVSELDSSLLKVLPAKLTNVSISVNGAGVKPLSTYLLSNSKVHFGPELFAVLRLVNAFPQRHYLLIKEAVGGTSLYGAWRPVWSAKMSALTENGAKKQQMKLFVRHLENIRRQLYCLTTEGKPFKVIACLWMQGEQDTRREISAAAYRTNLGILIAAYRSELRLPDLPFVFGQVNAPPRKYQEGIELVRTGMSAVAATSKNVSMITTSMDGDWMDFPKQRDNLHYNTAGQQALGEAMGKELLIFLAH